MDLADYRALNESFDRTLVFRLGAEAGFFSEVNNLVLAVLYCLRHEVQFVLSSQDAHFGVGRGWQDLFLAFCAETEHAGHGRFNRRFHDPRLSFTDLVDLLRFKREVGVTYLTQEVWPEFRSPEFAASTFTLPGHPPLDLRAAGGAIVRMLWRYEPATAREIDALRRSVSLSSRYLGAHVRSGDKHFEADLVDLDRYVETARSRSDLTDVFLLTDDHRIVEDARLRHPDLVWSTLCTPDEQGYAHAAFVRQPASVRRAAILRLLASVDLLADAELFVGTFNSNPGMHLGMRMPEGRAIGVDHPTWFLW